MQSADELRKTYLTLDREQKLDFLDGVTELLQRHEDSKSNEYGLTKLLRQRIALLTDSVELHQLIHAVKNQKTATRKNPRNDARELWQLIKKFIEGV